MLNRKKSQIALEYALVLIATLAAATYASRLVKIKIENIFRDLSRQIEENVGKINFTEQGQPLSNDEGRLKEKDWEYICENIEK